LSLRSSRLAPLPLGYDAVLAGSYVPPLLNPNIFDFIVDLVPSSDSHLGVLPGVEDGISTMVKEWGEENVWNRDEEEEKEREKQGKGRKRGRKKKKREDVWDSDTDSD